ncbi:hypothetical protein [Streptomyces sp. NPDC051776]|uniref:hypothetical protein n=1 Tax=Streptomyces sp. NPDC051776 TaxID=3155414 RepID=UPI0034309378
MQSARVAPTARRQRSRRIRGRVGPFGRPLPWLAGVAVVFTVLQLVLVVPGEGLGWDETVYVSQVSPYAPTAFFSAPRARGISFLVAPVTVLTASTTVLRVYLAVLSGAGLFLALRVWRRLIPAPVLALAGALFAGLWVTLFYGPQVMPNLWVAYAALLATGCFLRAAGDRTDRRALLGLAAGVAFAALMRFSDALWLALPLAGAALFVRDWRRPALLVALVLGAAAGCAEWVVEAYVRYGGLAARLERASEIQGGMGWHLAFDDHLRALEGRTLCRPCDVRRGHPAAGAWWFMLPLLTSGGLLAASRARRLATLLVPTLTALSLAVPYVLMLDYAAPRFLLPSYALLALPVAVCVVWLVTGLRQRLLMPIAAAAVALVILGHLSLQYAVLHGVVARSREARGAVGRIAAELQREGVRPPCVVTGAEAVRIAYRAGCSSRQAGGHDGSVTGAGLAAMARTKPVAVLVAGDGAAPPYARGWRTVSLPRLGGLHSYRAHVSPSAVSRSATR